MTTYKTKITGTTPYVNYQFRVRANNQQGTGEWSMALGDLGPSPDVQFNWNKATGGNVPEGVDVENYDGTTETWRVHTFTTGGTFDTELAIHPCRVLVVAAGGGGTNGAGNDAQNFGGGRGGAGGMLENMALTVPEGPVTVSVGQNNSPGNTGAKSSFGSYISCSGGGHGNGGNGGSGGGGGGWRPGTDGGQGPDWYGIKTSGGSGVSGQGTNGANADTNAGHGGAGGGAGGLNKGRVSSITGNNVTYAPGAYGSGGNSGSPRSKTATGGKAGVVIVAYRVG